MNPLLDVRGFFVDLPTAADWVRPVTEHPEEECTRELLAAVPEIPRTGQV